MTNNEAIEILRANRPDACFEQLREAVDKAIDALEEPEPHWIPCSERLPEDGKWCLFTDGGNMSVERYKADALDHFFPEGRWFSLEDAVAWMPLPEPYQECDKCTDCVGECQEGAMNGH